MHKTKWEERQTLFWVCSGCFKQCQVCRHKPDDDLDCDSTEDGINNVIVVKGFKFTKKGISKWKHVVTS